MYWNYVKFDLLVHVLVFVTIPYLYWWSMIVCFQLQREFGDVHAIVQTLIQFMPSVTITVLNIIVPIIFVKLVQFEDYMPAFQMQITLLRWMKQLP